MVTEVKAIINSFGAYPEKSREVYGIHLDCTQGEHWIKQEEWVLAYNEAEQTYFSSDKGTFMTWKPVNGVMVSDSRPLTTDEVLILKQWCQDEDARLRAIEPIMAGLAEEVELKIAQIEVLHTQIKNLSLTCLPGSFVTG